MTGACAREILGQAPLLLLGGALATVALATILGGSQGLGLSRLSLPFLIGTAFTRDSRRAMVIGFVFYVLGGFLFAGLYDLVFLALGAAHWWLGALLGVGHGLFILVVLLPLAPYLHPRMATDHDGPWAARRIEPPGFLGLNYGRATPLVTLLGQVVYGAILGAFLPGQ
jgi:hypothetical protein